jgi:hypothetical protein
MGDIGTQVTEMWEKNKAHFERKLDGWLRAIKESQSLLRDARTQFHQWGPLRVYVSVAKAASRSRPVFSLRFFGQEVAELLVKDSGITLRLKRHSEKNLRCFQCPRADGDYRWHGPEAVAFRRHFKDLASSTGGKPKVQSPEHRVEAKFLQEMLKGSGKFGVPDLRIQPVMIGACPLQFPLPISASSGCPKEGNGHIDILARRLGAGNKRRLSVWELKKPETYGQAASQAYIYARTLLHVLRDTKNGQEWYKVFGYKGQLPRSLELEAVVAITRDQEGQFITEKKELDKSTSFVIGGDSIRLYAAYYIEEGQSIRLESGPFAKD